MRSAAQIVSYEIPAGLAILTIVFLAGTMSMQGIIKAQGWAPWDWFLFNNPFTFAAFFLYFTAALAEGNRTPFDIPEAESELVAGYVTEYSGMRFLFFFFAEWGNLYVIGAVATTLFLGGWQVPPLPIFDNNLRALGRGSVRHVLSEGLYVGVRRHVGPRDLAAGARRSTDGALLEVHGAVIVYLFAGHDRFHVCAGGSAADHQRGHVWALRFAIMIIFLVRVVFQMRNAKPELYFKPHI